MAETYTWGSWEFEIYELNTNWNDVGGVYIFTSELPLLYPWEPLYIGKTGSFKDRLTSSHDKWDEAIAKGMDHIHVMVVPLADNRAIIEELLIQRYNPPLNKT